MYLLNTNVVSELRKAKTGRADKRIIAWAESVSTVHFYLSVISVLELEIGVLSMERRDSTQGVILRTWLDEQVLPTFADRIIPIDVAVTRQCAKLHVPNSHSERDALIAASALVHNLTVVTRKIADFMTTSVKVINPWRI
jgi:predicted nucleic acid-binding protein